MKWTCSKAVMCLGNFTTLWWVSGTGEVCQTNHRSGDISLGHVFLLISMVCSLKYSF